MNFRYPIFLDVANKRCLVTGAGPELTSKLRMLLSRGARVLYVNPTATVEIAALASAGQIIWHAREFQTSDLDQCLLVITSLADNSAVFRSAEEKNVLCNAADDPAHCRFSFGSVVSRGDLTVAISTNGAAPALAVRLRERLEQQLGDEYAEFVTLLAELRAEIANSLPDFERRKTLWYRLVDSAALAAIRQGRTGEAHRILRDLLDEAKRSAGNPVATRYSEE